MLVSIAHQANNLSILFYHPNNKHMSCALTEYHSWHFMYSPSLLILYFKNRWQSFFYTLKSALVFSVLFYKITVFLSSTLKCQNIVFLKEIYFVLLISVNICEPPALIFCSRCGYLTATWQVSADSLIIFVIFPSSLFYLTFWHHINL